MKTIKRSALVTHSAETLYRLVNDVEAYPAFLPWCAASGVIESSPSEMIAWLELRAMGVAYRFTTRNQLTPYTSILLKLEEGPFSRFSGEWRFQQLGDDGSKVSLDLQFDFRSRALALGIGSVFGEAADRMVDAFCKRADELAG